jgi:hypothetical protein
MAKGKLNKCASINLRCLRSSDATPVRFGKMPPVCTAAVMQVAFGANDIRKWRWLAAPILSLTMTSTFTRLESSDRVQIDS